MLDAGFSMKKLVRSFFRLVLAPDALQEQVQFPSDFVKPLLIASVAMSLDNRRFDRLNRALNPATLLNISNLGSFVSVI